MKKMLAMFIVVILAFLFGVGIKTKATSSPDSWLDQSAKISEEVYTLLKERAGFASYIYTDTKISMDPQNLSTFIIEEKFEDYFIGKFYSNANKVLVTKDGLVVSYTPKEVAHTIYPNDRHFLDVQATVKTFIGPTIEKVNYINFASLDSTEAISYYDSSSYSEKRKVIIPLDARINHVGYSRADSYNRGYYMDYYGTIVAGSLQSGSAHNVSSYGRYIDNIQVFTKSAESMNIFYTSNTPITVQGSTRYSTYNLIKKFIIGGSTPSENSLKEIQIQPASIVMTPGELLTMGATGMYTDGSKKSINSSEVTWTSTSPNVADFSSGKLLAITPGETTLIARYNGYTAIVAIRVQVSGYKELSKKVDIATNKKWEIKFNAAVDIQSVTETNIFVTDSNGIRVPLRYNFINNKNILLNPTQDKP